MLAVGEIRKGVIGQGPGKVYGTGVIRGILLR